MRRALMVLAVSCLGVVGTVAPAAASPIAVFEWQLTGVDSGSFQSKLSLSNLTGNWDAGDPLRQAFYDATLTLSADGGATVVAALPTLGNPLDDSPADWTMGDFTGSEGEPLSADVAFTYLGVLYTGTLTPDDLKPQAGYRSASLELRAIPEPSTLLLCASGVALALRRRRAR
jgi:hypothetical protein